MKTLFTELRQLLEQGEEAVLVTIIASSGSTPRGTGSRMLVRKDGSIEGTVGGGAVEYQAMQTALKAMEDKASFAKGFTLTRNQVADIGMVCGGNVVVYFQYIRPATRRCPVSAARSWMPWQRMRTAGLYWISPTRHAGRWVCTAEAWAWPGLRGWDSCRRRSFSEAMPSRRKWMGVSFISSPWYRRGLSIYSEAVMWPGSWFRCWPCGI